MALGPGCAAEDGAEVRGPLSEAPTLCYARCLLLLPSHSIVERPALRLRSMLSIAFVAAWLAWGSVSVICVATLLTSSESSAARSSLMPPAPARLWDDEAMLLGVPPSLQTCAVGQAHDHVTSSSADTLIGALRARFVYACEAALDVLRLWADARHKRNESDGTPTAAEAHAAAAAHSAIPWETIVQGATAFLRRVYAAGLAAAAAAGSPYLAPALVWLMWLPAVVLCLQASDTFSRGYLIDAVLSAFVSVHTLLRERLHRMSPFRRTRAQYFACLMSVVLVIAVSRACGALDDTSACFTVAIALFASVGLKLFWRRYSERYPNRGTGMFPFFLCTMSGVTLWEVVGINTDGNRDGSWLKSNVSATPYIAFCCMMSAAFMVATVAHCARTWRPLWGDAAEAGAVRSAALALLGPHLAHNLLSPTQPARNRPIAMLASEGLSGLGERQDGTGGGHAGVRRRRQG